MCVSELTHGHARMRSSRASAAAETEGRQLKVSESLAKLAAAGWFLTKSSEISD